MPRTSFVFLALLSAQALADAVPKAAINADDVCKERGDCALNALQHVRVSALGTATVEGSEARVRREGPAMSSPASVPHATAFTFAGGGYKAMATYFGVISSMINIASKTLGCNATLTEVFKNADGFVSNSGGGWFFSQMAYSPKYERLLTESARTPRDAGRIYNEQWTGPFLHWARTGESAFTFLTIVDDVIETEHTLQQLMFEHQAPVQFLSSTVGLALHGLRLGGKIDEVTHSLLESVLVSKGPCICEGMALSRGGRATNCGCQSFNQVGADVDLEMAFHEQSVEVTMDRLLGLQKPTMMEKIKDAVLGLAQNLRAFYGIWRKTKLTWYNIVLGMLVSGAELNPNTQFGTTYVNDFAHGKLWVACISLITPGGRGKDLDVKAYMTRKQRLTYTTATPTGQDFNLYTPAKISVYLGAGSEQEGQGHLCAVEDCFGMYNQWKMTTKIPFVTIKRDAKPFAPFLNIGMKSAGVLMLARLVASSSAALGSLVLMPSYGLGRSMSTWVARSIHPQDQADIIMSRAEARGDKDFWRSLRDYAHWNVMPIVDGVLSENTGVMNAVASGHTEITSLPAFGVMYLLKLFSNYMGLPEKERAGASDANQMGGIPHIDCFVLDASQVLGAVNNFTQLRVRPTSVFLNNISYGSVVTNTATNMWAGITAGTEVKLNILITLSSIGIQGTNAFESYGTFIQDITVSYDLPENLDKAKQILNDFYFTVADRAPPTGCSTHMS